MQTALTYRTNRDLFSNHYLDEHLRETEEWDEVSDDEIQEAYDDIMALWEREKSTAPKRNESQLEEKFIRPMFRKLGIPFEVEESTSRTQRRPDYGFFETEEAARDAFERREEGGDFYENAVAVADAKRWGRALDTRGSGEHERDFENPSYQIHVYLQETPAEWAVLTNGKKWRLYYAPTSHRLDSYYEIDLPTVLENGDLEDFKYFYLFFRQEAFRPDTSGDSFLDDVYDQSNRFAQELGEDLQDNIYEAIKVLSEGFLEYPENNLDEDDLDRIHDSSLIYLYRLIFVLYAESEGRDLLDTSNEIYEQSYSLNTLKEDVAEELDSSNPSYRAWQDTLWSRLDELFKLIDQGSESRGIPKDDLYVPAYNGGLFRTNPDEDGSEEAVFLANHEVGDAYLARVIDLLARSQTEEGGKTFVDYSSLGVRHLGSVYEGLLEYQLHVADEPLALEDGEYVPADEGEDVAVEEGKVYLTTDGGERKATGSYYTPEYVVEYIVEETLGPLVDDIREDLVAQSARGDQGFAEEFAERVFELKVLDPAMGSGHFLTSAVDYLAREIIDAQEKQAAQQGVETIDEDHDINWARRKVAQRCIYGVDLNPLAVELAKVSLWLRTLAAEQPLAFLDHHLKAGNSLVGSDIKDVLAQGEDATSEGGQLTLQQSFDHTRQQALEHVMERFTDLLAIDNETLSDIKEMEEVYEEVREDDLYQHLLAMANVQTAAEFGLDVPDDAEERMAESLRSGSWDEIENQDWFKNAQAMADDESFFHWELEYPVAFYGDDGKRLDDAGFDVVIGNPPYVRIYGDRIPEQTVEYWRQKYEEVAHMKFDLYVLFLAESINLVRSGGLVSEIVPDKFLMTPYGEPLREKILNETDIRSIGDLRNIRVFESASVSNVIPTLEKSNKHSTEFEIHEWISGNIQAVGTVPTTAVVSDDDSSFRLERRPIDVQISQKIEEQSIRFDEIYYSNWGLRTGTAEKTEKFVVEEKTDTEDAHPMIRGQDIAGRYVLEQPSEYIIYQPEELYNPMFPELFENPKIVFRKISGEGLMAVVDEDGYYCFSTLIPCVNLTDIQDVERQGIQSATKRAHQYDDPYFVLALVNSNLLHWYYQINLSDDLSVVPGHIQQLPVYDVNFEGDSIESEETFLSYEQYLQGKQGLEQTVSLVSDHSSSHVFYQVLGFLAESMMEYNRRHTSLNLDLLDYLGNYMEGSELPDIGLFKPASSNILDATTEEYEKLRVGDVKTKRDRHSVTIFARARYKPEDEDEFETDQWGYRETDFYEAFTLTDLSKEEASLVEEFVPVAVEEADGFAGFRDNATKTNSPIDRLKAITLPDPDDVADDLERYIEVKERADELDEKIKKTDELIDEIVYDLYGLTDEEIEIVEEAVQDD
ncbi:hypothetical protein GCM10009037_30660 [Halarchaeum grantii]|uniref:site-specific DNA-methyltransferase (adenine-specific) n=1 Tax=Halarchaeum grantii TaxID=1193105 RepID=A0A830F6Z6_9EURY|nr:TaqI-like C-terminal specificity domain-containing protein [Halarchaeum grantii]GGL45138.1 hypothetical protein GCM10009037_30660 [Halarchaeum grantii]